jgi:hypothetical protein
MSDLFLMVLNCPFDLQVSTSYRASKKRKILDARPQKACAKSNAELEAELDVGVKIVEEEKDRQVKKLTDRDETPGLEQERKPTDDSLQLERDVVRKAIDAFRRTAAAEIQVLRRTHSTMLEDRRAAGREKSRLRRIKNKIDKEKAKLRAHEHVQVRTCLSDCVCVCVCTWMCECSIRLPCRWDEWRKAPRGSLDKNQPALNRQSYDSRLIFV